MAGFCGQLIEGLQEGFFGAATRIKPSFGTAWRQVNSLVRDVIRRAEQRTVPFLRQGLPVQIVGGGGPLNGGRSSGAVLVNDNAAQGLDAIGNPESISDGSLQFAGLGRDRIVHLQILSGSAQRSRPVKDSNSEDGEGHEPEASASFHAAGITVFRRWIA